MTKLLSMPSSIKQIKDILDLVDGFILSIAGLSVNSSFYIDINTLEEIKKIAKTKSLFVSLNKNMFNSDLKLLEETLIKLSNMNIDGVFYYDLSVLELTKKLNLNLDLVWSQEHLTTNYLTCNYYYEKNVKYVYLSSEITLKEILEIKEKSNSSLIVPVFGYLPMFDSKRHIVKNYLDYFNLKDDSKINYIEKEGKSYPIIDEKQGTTVYNYSILNGLDEYLILKDNSVSYVILNSFNIDDDKYKEVLNCFKNVNKDNLNEYNQKINEMFENVDKGFLYKETIYRVKKDEKSN